MSNVNDANAKKLFVKECLFTALMLLMQKKDFNKITITDLTKKAGVSRMAFYRNYNSVIDILYDYFYSHPFGLNDDSLNPEKFVLFDAIFNYFKYIVENRVLIENLINSNLTYIILDFLDDYCRGPFLPILNSLGFVDKYEISAFIGIVYKATLDWVKNGMVESLDEVIKIGYDLVIVHNKNYMKLINSDIN